MEFEMLASGYGLLEAPRVDDMGRFYFTEYSVAVIVNISRDNLVEDARVERWGVGL